jgi:hypothetical protein
MSATLGQKVPFRHSLSTLVGDKNRIDAIFESKNFTCSKYYPEQFQERPTQVTEENSQSPMHHEAGTSNENSITTAMTTAAILDDGEYVPVNYISSELLALLAAAEASAARRADAMDLGTEEHDDANNDLTMPGSVIDGKYDPVRILQCMAPPKRFYRTFWKLISRRLLAATTACPC